MTALAREGANAEPPGSRDLLRRFRDNAKTLARTTAKLSHLTAAGNPVPGETEWLLDNYYIIEEVVREVRHDLPRRYYRELPALGFGHFTGMPRVYPVAATLLGHTDSALSEPQIREVVKAYQETTPLSTGEVWAFPTMLRLALLENLRRLGDQIMATIASRDEAMAAVEAARAQRVPRLPRLPSDAFIVALADGLRDNEPQPGAAADAVEAWSTRYLLDLAQARHREYSRQAANQVSIGNAVTSLRLLGVIDWAVFFEATSLVEAELRTDPGEVYPRQDFATRDRCRRAVETLARGSGWTEIGVARAAVTAATAHARDPLSGQVSWFLLGDGRAEFERSLDYRPRPSDRWRGWLLGHPYAAYFGSLLGVLALIVVSAAVLSWHAVWLALLVALACLLPASEVAVYVANFLLCRLLPPRVLPRLDLRQGIPEDCSTFVVVPTLIGKPSQAAGLVERLEQHYLANPDPRLVFALLTDFTDAPTETTPADEACVRGLLDGIAKLNARYAPDSTARFYLFHRKRLFDPPENVWMGWERKRGKLQEFNDLLRGDTHTSFTTTSVPLPAVPRVRFVLTLDTDTVLPRDAARSMIAAMAHPLNAPRLSADGRRVEAGFGVLQPRVSFLYTTGFRSWFARLFAGSVGIDPYSTAVSDTYMDLFGRGTFTGKGLYDVDAFRATADRAFPENHILSHDLIESNYARCALATDVEVFDEFPARYHAFARRDHRWVRGDWQLLPWLGPTVPLPGGGRAPNVLPALERWKVIDNLRRSLVPAGVVALVVLGGTVLPGSVAGWLLLALMPFLLPPVLYVVQAALRLLTGAPPRAEFARAGTDFVNTLGQSALLIVFIANQAWICLDAIARTLWRMFVSRRHLLEWETAAATEKRLGSGLVMFVGTMWPACLIAVVGSALVWRVDPEHLFFLGPLFAAWLLSPLVAWGVSAPRRLQETPLATAQVKELRRIARKTWDFFETFVGDEDNWLPPDNYQEVPRGIVAHRTSPTNMGLYLLATLAAHDFGYVSTEDMLARLKHSLDTFDKLERYRGHFINWYETNTLATLHPAYVSTVDSGNLLACFIALANGMVEKARFEPSDAPRQGLRDTLALVEAEWATPHKYTQEASKAVADGLRAVGDALSAGGGNAAGLARVLAEAEKLLGALNSRIDDPAAPVHRWAHRLVELARRHHQEAVESASKREAWVVALLAIERRCRGFAAEMNFTFLYNPDRELFSIGYNVPAGRLDPSHYDLLASEACIASFLAVARGEVPRKHWFQLGRLATRAAGDIGLVSWGGTMFEYLMPRLLLPVPPGVLLDQAQKTAVRRQIQFGHECHLPWGVSESGFYVFDAAQVYQYQSFGVPGLGLKRGLDRDRVIAPYATLLAIDVSPVEALANLARIRDEGGEGAYGFHEAVDYTPSRVPEGSRNQVVRSYMAHHQGMGFLAIVNRLTGGLVRRRLGVEPAVRAAELLLAERIPYEAPALEPQEAEAETSVRLTTTDAHVRRRISTPDTPAPRPHLLSNGRYSVMVTNSGAGYSRCGDLDVTRWRADATADDTGTFLYVRDKVSGGVWSAGYQPVRRRSEVYEVTYSLDKADFRRIDDGVETLTEITVAADQDVEVRRVTLTNLGDGPREMEVVSYAEIVLAPHAADVAHPAFGKLFIETEWLPEHSAILCRRRPRTPDQAPIWAVHVVASDAPGDVRFETDRAKFLGRRRDASNPRGVEEATGGATGPVLDPVVAISRSVVVGPGEKVVVAFATGVAVSRESALALADLYNATHAVTRVFELAWARARIELQHTQLRAEDIHLFQRLAGHLLFPTGGMRAGEDVLAANRLGQSSLWRFGISGDLPIAVLALHSGAGLGHLKQMLQGHAVWLARGLRVDLVVLLGNAGGYLDELYTEAMNVVRSAGLGELIDRPGGVFVRKASQMSQEDQTLILSSARLLIDDRAGPFATQANAPVVPRPLPARRTPRHVPARFDTIRRPGDLAFWNGYGGFGEGGREYLIGGDAADRPTPTPWINVIANPAGGFLVSDGGGGFTWAGNSQSNRLTPWSNDPVSDPAGEAIYVQDDATGTAWNPTPGPIRDGGGVQVRHGQGYTTFERVVNEVHHELTVFMPVADPVKVSLLKLRNTSAKPQRLNLLYYVEWVLGTQREATSAHILTEVDAPTGALFARNPYHPEIGSHVAFLDVSLRPRSVSGDRAECLGRNGSPAAPAALERVGLSGRVGAGLDPCGAVRASVSLAPGQEETVVFLLGEAADAGAARVLVKRYADRAAAAAACTAVVEKWDRICGAVQVQTPDNSFDLLLNRWLIYQTLSCRLWGRSAFYQSGGAYGFRDQLQDVMALLHAAPDQARAQLLRAGRHQFREGDVLHWWHEPMGNGVRTKFSDDFLWLPYAVCHYVRVTGDLNVCDVMLPYIDAPLLREDQHETYLVPTVTEFAETLYAHCARALDNGWKLGAHGLPLMGCGDWNDGMSTVGIHGKGESVWVAWFQAVCLDLFAELADRRGDAERAHTCRTRAAELRAAVEKEGHDGGWYRRAYFDDGTPLGSAQNDECRLDSLTQSWAVIAGGDRGRTAQGMDAVMRTLVREEDRLILLFEPPFDKGALQPGYIKGYVPGVRENGGQYTHAGCWVVKALADLGRADEAFEAFALLDPIRATETTQGVERYRGEPYVLAGDVYSCPQHVGRAGWTWYTGSSSWLYRVGTEDILGLHRVGDKLRIEPCVPASWPGFRVRYRFGEAVYDIEVKVSHPAGPSPTRLVIDGKEQDDAVIRLIDDKREHAVVVTFGTATARRSGEARQVEATR